MLRDISIRRKVTLVILLGCLLTVLLAALGLGLRENATFQSRTVRLLTAQADMISASVYGAFDFADPRVAEEVLGALHVAPDIASARLFTLQGLPFARYLREPEATSEPHVLLPDGTYRDGQELVLVTTLAHGGQPFARLCLHSDLRDARARFWESLATLGVVFLLVLVAAVWLSHLLQRAITLPLLKLADTARAVSQQKNYQIRAAKESTDEIGRLADDFNAMLETVQERDQALRAQEAFLDQLIESAGDAIFLCDLDGNFIRVNEQACTGLGYRREELLRLKVWDVDTRVQGPEDLRRLLAPIQTGGSLMVEGSHRHASGRLIPVEVRLSCMRTAAGTFTVGFARDVTERRRTEAELRRLAAAIENAAEDITITDLQGVIEYVNPAFERTTGYTRAEAIGHTPRILKSGRHQAAFYRQLWSTLSGGQVWTGRFTNRCKDGRFVEEDATISPFRDTQGNVVGFVAVRRDVTEQIRLEEQLRQSQRLEAVGQLAGGVAHDFNNILTVILGHVAVLQQEIAPGSSLASSLTEIAQASERAAGLTRQLLTFSRRQVIQRRPVNLNEVVEGLSKMVLRLIGEHIRLEPKLAATLPAVLADPGMLEQILVNLAVNARDAMPGGGHLTLQTEAVHVTATEAQLHPEWRAGPFVRLTVTDTGCGMGEDVVAHLFEPFFTTKEVGKGTGLGLATVRSIVKQHEGWVAVHTAVGRGTRFDIYLPASPEVQPAPAASPSTADRLPGGDETILLVEDEEAVRRLIQNLLTRRGYRVLAAVDGTEALRLWAAHGKDIDLLLTDMVMPGGVTGRELARRLRSDRPSLPVICSSGYTVDLQAPDLAGNLMFLPKPHKPEQLLRLVRSCLDQ